MDQEPALELIEQVRSEYEDSAVFGEEVNREVVENHHQDTFRALPQCLPVQYNWVEGESVPEIAGVSISNGISNIHQLERRFLIKQLEEAGNVSTVSISELSHNTLVEALMEVYSPTTFYVPESKHFQDIDSRSAIRGVVDSFDELERRSINADVQDDLGEAIYAIHGNHIRVRQCTRPPVDQSDWLPERTHRDINRGIQEHPLYCAYGEYNQVDADYVIATASIPACEPHIRDNAAVKITVDETD